MNKGYFTSAQASHAHSLETLNLFYEHDDFMESVSTVLDLGCGAGQDLEWWATRTTRDEQPRALNIQCMGVDMLEQLPVAHQYDNISYLKQDFSDPIRVVNRKFDVLWCHDAFQYVVDPFTTLKSWREKTAESGMLCLILPQTTNLEGRYQAFDQPDNVYFNWTIVSLIHVLATCGWDCSSGYFKKAANDPWLHAVVYRSEHEPLNPKTTQWAHLAERGLLPESAAKSINQFGLVRQRDLVLPWVDHSLTAFFQH